MGGRFASPPRAGSSRWQHPAMSFTNRQNAVRIFAIQLEQVVGRLFPSEEASGCLAVSKPAASHEPQGNVLSTGDCWSSHCVLLKQCIVAFPISRGCRGQGLMKTQQRGHRTLRWSFFRLSCCRPAAQSAHPAWMPQAFRECLPSSLEKKTWLPQVSKRRPGYLKFLSFQN